MVAALRHSLRRHGLHDRRIERLVVVIADRRIELGAGLHAVDHVLRAAVARIAAYSSACALFATRSALTGQITIR